MADNNAVTKEDLQSLQEELQNALGNVVAQLTKLVQETAAATEAKLTAEIDRRFNALRSDLKTRKDLTRQQDIRKKHDRERANISQKGANSVERFWPPEFYGLTSVEKEAHIAAEWRKRDERHAKEMERLEKSMSPELAGMTTEERYAYLERQLKEIEARQKRLEEWDSEYKKAIADGNLSWNEKVRLLKEGAAKLGFKDGLRIHQY